MKSNLGAFVLRHSQIEKNFLGKGLAAKEDVAIKRVRYETGATIADVNKACEALREAGSSIVKYSDLKAAVLDVMAKDGRHP